MNDAAIIPQLQGLLQAVPTGRARFAARAMAMESLEKHALERLDILSERAPLSAELALLRSKALALYQALEAGNRRVVERLRHRISAGRYTPAGLKQALARLGAGSQAQEAYDTLDLFVDGLLGIGAPPPGNTVLEPEMVYYQPTPIRAVLALLDQATLGPDDVFYDLGSGLGQVVILVALLSPAQARGIELEAAYCEQAEHCARRLNIQRAAFIQGDARTASLAEGSFFFLYTPFRGGILRQVLARLRAEAGKRPIRIGTYGPCTLDLAQETWLKREEGGKLDEQTVSIFHSC